MANDLHLQFQAAEGLAASKYHMGHYSEAVSYFNAALELLEEIGEDTDTDQERVRQKLSDATEALQTHGETLHRCSSTESNLCDSGQSGGPLEPASIRDITHASRGLPPLVLSQEPAGLISRDTHLSVGDQPGTSGMVAAGQLGRTTRKHAKPRRNRQAERRSKITSERLPTTERTDSYEQQLRSYVDMYREEPGGQSLPSSSGESDGGLPRSRPGTEPSGRRRQLPPRNLSPIAGLPLSAGSSPFPSPSPKFVEREEESPPGTSHSGAGQPSSHKRRLAPHNLSPIAGLPLSAGSSPFPSPSPGQVVQEGSLAIGPHAREMFMTRTHLVQSGRRKSRLLTEIVPINEAHDGEGSSNGDSSSSSPQLPKPTPRHQQQPPQPTRVCVIL